MSKEMLMMVESIAREKDLPEEMVFQALEESLAFAAKKRIGGEPKITVEIDRQTGEQTVVRHFHIFDDVDELDNEDVDLLRCELTPERAAIVGDATELEEVVDVDFGRSSAQFTKQAIYQKLRDIEQRSALDEIRAKNEGLLYGTVKGFQKGNALLEIGRLEALLPKSETLPKDMLKVGSRVKVAIKSVDKMGARDVVTVSRATPEFMRLLIEQEVAQVEDGSIEIVKLVRAPGIRCKMIVRSHMGEGKESSRAGGMRLRNDPARIIIGSKGIHAKAIAEETGEHMDIIEENEDPAQMVIQALLPAEPSKIRIDEETRLIEAAIPGDALGLVIGKGGANVRLISELLGWNVEVMDEAGWEEKEHARAVKAVEAFIKGLDVDEELAQALAAGGFASIEELAYSPVEEIAAVDGLDEEVATEIQARAQEAAQTKEREVSRHYGPARESLLKVEGISEEEIEQLVKAEIYSADDLADLATDELMELLPHWRQARAQALIMSARKLWETTEA